MHTRVGLHSKYPRKFNPPLIHLRAFNADTLFKATSWELIWDGDDPLADLEAPSAADTVIWRENERYRLRLRLFSQHNATRRHFWFHYPFFTIVERLRRAVLYRWAYIFAQRRDSIKTPCQIVKKDAIKVL